MACACPWVSTPGPTTSRPTAEARVHHSSTVSTVCDAPYGGHTSMKIMAMLSSVMTMPTSELECNSARSQTGTNTLYSAHLPGIPSFTRANSSRLNCWARTHPTCVAKNPRPTMAICGVLACDIALRNSRRGTHLQPRQLLSIAVEARSHVSGRQATWLSRGPASLRNVATSLWVSKPRRCCQTNSSIGQAVGYRPISIASALSPPSALA